MILTRAAIQEGVGKGDITLSPFRESQLNPASYDVRLGTSLVCYHRIHAEPLDSKKANPTQTFDLTLRPEMGFTLLPGFIYLACTEEVVHTDKYVIIADGKSSLGRLGLFVHVTAGYVDPGFNGQITLELAVVEPLVIYAGMRIAQLRFEPLQGEPTLYNGNYVGETAMGPQPSRSWNQFGRDDE